MLFTLIYLFCSSRAFALGVGQLRTQSALNQPFYGEITLADVSQNELDNLKVSLANHSAFEQAGIERPHSLTRLQFTPMIGPQGKPIIQVATREPIREPFLNILVEVIWPDGRLVKEYAVLLDPPALGNSGSPAASTPRPAPSGSARRTRASPFVQAAGAGTGPSPGPATAPSPTPSTPPPRSSASVGEQAVVEVPAAATDTGFPLRVGPVPSGVGLARIARRVAPPGATFEQTALALYRNNQSAFIGGDINRLRRGSRLSIPSAAELFVLDAEAARQAYRAALAGREVARVPLTAADVELRIMTDAERGGTVPAGALAEQTGPVTVDEPRESSEMMRGLAALESEMLLVREANESNRQETDALRERMLALEARINDVQRLLELRNQHLVSLADQQAEAPVSEETAKAVADAAAEGLARPEPEPDAAERPEAGTAVGAADAEAAHATASATADARNESEASTASPTPATTTDANPPGLVAGLIRALGAWWLPLLGAVAVLALLGWLIQRRRQRAMMAPAPVAGEEPPRVPFEEGADQAVAEVQPPPAPLPNALIIGPQAGAEAAKTTTTAESTENAEAEISDGEAVLSSVSEGGDEPFDRLAEAEIYLGYGRYRDAEHVLQEVPAEQSTPALRFKLAEIYLAVNDKTALAELAETMRGAGDPARDRAHWAQIEAALGRTAETQSAAPLSLDSALAPDTQPAEAVNIAREQAAAPPPAPDELFLDLDALEVDSDSKEQEGLGPSPPGVSAKTEPYGVAEQDSGPTEMSEEEGLDLDLAALGNLMETSSGPESAQEEGAPQGVVQDSEAQSEHAPLVLPTLDEPSESGPGADEPGADKHGPTDQGRDGESVPGQETALPLQAEEWDDGMLKLDLARAYVDMGDAQAARTILKDVMAEGRAEQRQEAEALLARLDTDGAGS